MYNDQMSQKQMMDWIMCLNFCADDMKLYLDTHWKDEEALEYYNQCQEVLANARKNYEQNYGPLTLEGRGKMNGWDWNCGPMPWEGAV